MFIYDLFSDDCPRKESDNWVSCGDCYLSFEDEDALAEHQQSQHVEHVEQIFFQEQMKPDMAIIVKVCGHHQI